MLGRKHCLVIQKQTQNKNYVRLDCPYNNTKSILLSSWLSMVIKLEEKSIIAYIYVLAVILERHVHDQSKGPK